MKSFKSEIVTIICSLLLLFIPLLFAGRILELPSIDQRVLAGVFLVPMISLYFRWISGDHHQLWLPIHLATATMVASVAYSWTKQNGEAVAQLTAYLAENQQAVVLLLLLITSTNLLIGLTSGFSNRIASGAASLSGTPAYKKQAESVTVLDKSIIAVHEAGHAILLGLHKDLPETSELILRQEATDTGSLGHCTGVAWEHRISSKTFVEWNMLFCLAGVEAERLVLGEVSLGGSSDYRNWQDLAHQYLGGHDSIVYFHDIKAPWQEDFNAKVLYDLKEQQKAVVRDMLLENEDVLIILRDALLERGAIRGKDFLDVLSMVVPTANTPSAPLFKVIS